MATAPFWLYGANPSELAQQQMAYERQFTSAAEGNRQAAFSAAQASINNQQQNRNADDTLRVADARNRMSAFFAQQQRMDAARQEAENQRRYDTELGMRFQDQDWQRQIDRRFNFPKMEADLDLSRQKAANEKTYNPVALKMLEFSHKRAEEDAYSGNINSVADALRLYPGITSDQAAAFFQKSQQARAEIETERQELESAAKTLTAYERAKVKDADLLAEKPESDFWRWGSPNADDLANRRRSSSGLLQSLEMQAAALQKSGVMQRLQFDPETRSYTPMLPNLPWMKKAAETSTETTAAPVTPATPNAAREITATNASGQKVVFRNGAWQPLTN